MKTANWILSLFLAIFSLSACGLLDDANNSAEPYPGPSSKDYGYTTDKEDQQSEKKPAQENPGPGAKEYGWYDFSSHNENRNPDEHQQDTSQSENGQTQPDDQKPENSARYPLQIRATGIKTKFSGMNDRSCKVTTPLILTINADKTATLASKATNYNEYYNCTPGGIMETYTAEGTANENDQTAYFTMCNQNGYTAAGAISYKGGKLSGQVSCITKKGTTEVIFTAGK